MRLALAAGELDVDLMLSRMTPRQFDEWYALEHLEGIGAHRDDRRARHMTAALLQSQGYDVTPADLEYLPHLRDQADGFCDDDEGDTEAIVLAAFTL